MQSPGLLAIALAAFIGPVMVPALPQLPDKASDGTSLAAQLIDSFFPLKVDCTVACSGNDNEKYCDPNCTGCQNNGYCH